MVVLVVSKSWWYNPNPNPVNVTIFFKLEVSYITWAFEQSTVVKVEESHRLLFK